MLKNFKLYTRFDLTTPKVTKIQLNLDVSCS